MVQGLTKCLFTAATPFIIEVGSLMTLCPLTGFGRTISSNKYNEITETLTTKFIDFSAALQHDSVVLQWLVATESGSSYFEVQRSSNARTWKVVSIINVTNSASLVNNYSCSDKDLNRGQSFYRIRQVAINGNSRFSKTIAVYYAGQYRSGKVVASSTGGTFTLKNRSLTNRTMELYNQTGHRVIFKAMHEGEDTKIDLKTMPAGTYTLRINKGIVTPSIIQLVKN